MVEYYMNQEENLTKDCPSGLADIETTMLLPWYRPEQRKITTKQIIMIYRWNNLVLCSFLLDPSSACRQLIQTQVQLGDLNQ